MNDVEKMLAVEEIKRLKARYFRCVDSKKWSDWEGTFTSDATLDISDDVPGFITNDVRKFVESSRASLKDAVTVHHGHCPEIEILSDTTAKGSWAMEDVLTWPETSAMPIKALHGYGHYIESYVRVNGRWLISAMTLKRLRVDREPRTSVSGK